MGEPLPPPQQQCAAPLPNRPEEEALHLDHPTPASTDRQPLMQTPADAAAASTHADRQTGAPLFWSTCNAHSRSTSYHSISHLGPGTIQLEDHSEEQHEQTQGCWARSVTVDDYTVVSGSSGLGAYVVWSLTVSTLKGGDISIRKRYVLGSCYSVPWRYCIVCTECTSMFHILRSRYMMYHMLSAIFMTSMLLSLLSLLQRCYIFRLGTDNNFSRYSEFDRLRENLVKAFSHAESSIPQLPRKSVVSRFRPRFLEHRKNGLSHFIKYV